MLWLSQTMQPDGIPMIFQATVVAKLLHLLSPGIMSFFAVLFCHKRVNVTLRENPSLANIAITEIFNMFETIKSDGDIIARAIWQAFFHNTSQSDARCIHSSLHLASISGRNRGFAIGIPSYHIV